MNLEVKMVSGDCDLGKTLLSFRPPSPHPGVMDQTPAFSDK